MLNIFVVVEDKQDQQAAALEAIKSAFVSFEQVSRGEVVPGCPMVGLKSRNNEDAIQVLLANDLVWAKKKILFAKKLAGRAIVGVITDLMFPSKKGGEEEPNGLGVIAECIEANFPVVVCSDTDHHKVNYLRPVFPILSKAHPAGTIPVILDKKDWDRAVALLKEVLTGTTCS